MLQDVLRVSDLEPFVREIFAEDERLVSRILHGILQAQSPRLSDIRHAMERPSPSANSKALNRFLDEAYPWMPLLRLFDENAPFVMGDVTEVERRQAKKTALVKNVYYRRNPARELGGVVEAGMSGTSLGPPRWSRRRDWNSTKAG